MALYLSRPRRRSLTNPSLFHLFSTSSSSPPPNDPDAKTNFNINRNDDVSKHSSISPYLIEEFRKNFHRRFSRPPVNESSSAPSPGSPPISFQELNKRNVMQKAEDSKANANGSGPGAAGGGKSSLDEKENESGIRGVDFTYIRDGLLRVRAMYEEKQKRTSKTGKSKQFRWTEPMEHFLLEFLAKEAARAESPHNTFKHPCFDLVATFISAKFGVDCVHSHVENQLKTIKSKWNIITTLRNKSGFGWDDTLKMITADREVADQEVKAHPEHAQYLNRKIEMYDEMAMVVESFAQSFANVDLEESMHDESIHIEELGQGIEASSKSKSCHKRNRVDLDDENMEKISKQLGEIALAIKKLSEDPLEALSKSLYEQVMKVEGFDKTTLASAFVHLMERERLARAFMTMSDELKKLWLEDFRKE